MKSLQVKDDIERQSALGKRSILAHIIKVNKEAEMLELALIENLQRENLNAVEEAQAL